jgi:glycosyltransferase involved in cell wall biosynthesis
VPVRFFGQVEAAEVPCRLREIDIFVVPLADRTITRYASPIKVVEAMAEGCAVVATAVGDIPSLLSEGRGVVVPASDFAALQAAVSDLVDQPDQRLQLGRVAADWVATTLPWEKVILRYQSVYAAALERAS